MEVVIVPLEEVGRIAADAVEHQMRRKPDSVIGLATGTSPLSTYAELVRRHREEGLSFARATAFTLDEYVGLPVDHPQSYRNVIAAEFTDHVDFAPGAVHSPDPLARDVPAACADYERAIADAGGIDLQLLGIGTDGHVAFNEPGSSLSSRTRMKILTPQTRADNARFFDDDLDQVPQYCLTQGMGTIAEARHLVLIATGKAKQEAVMHLVEGGISARWPATALQWHPHLTVVLDDVAAGRLELNTYYKDKFIAKPTWKGY